MLRTLLRVTVAAGIGLVLVTGATVAVAETHAPTVSAFAGRPLAVVSLGDSYISGEAGRWKGNSVVGTDDRGGTDRAWMATPTGPSYDPARIYGPTAATGCHRSDVAPITHVRLLRPATINVA